MTRTRFLLPCLFIASIFTTQAQTLTTIAKINSCNEMGLPSFAGISTQDYYTIEGIALNDADVFNGEGDASFILYVQDDTGGIQVYSGAWYGGGLAIYPVIQQGERVRVTGLTGFYGGKTNINDRHNKDQTFTIERLGETEMPEPFLIEDLEAAQQFDSTRASGGADCPRSSRGSARTADRNSAAGPGSSRAASQAASSSAMRPAEASSSRLELDVVGLSVTGMSRFGGRRVAGKGSETVVVRVSRPAGRG